MCVCVCARTLGSFVLFRILPLSSPPHSREPKKVVHGIKNSKLSCTKNQILVLEANSEKIAPRGFCSIKHRSEPIIGKTHPYVRRKVDTFGIQSTQITTHSCGSATSLLEITGTCFQTRWFGRCLFYLIEFSTIKFGTPIMNIGYI